MLFQEMVVDEPLSRPPVLDGFLEVNAHGNDVRRSFYADGGFVLTVQWNLGGWTGCQPCFDFRRQQIVDQQIRF